MRHIIPVAVGLLAGLMACVLAAAQPPMLFDFESGGLDGWHLTEGGFGKLITDRAKFHNKPDRDYNKEGRYFLSTLEDPKGQSHDPYTGVVESPVFVLGSEEIWLRVGGGERDAAYVALCLLDGQEVRHARGTNSEEMQEHQWFVDELVGRPLFLRVVDKETRSWGHITLDAVRAQGRSDRRASEARRAKHQAELRTRELRQRFGALHIDALGRAIACLERRYSMDRGDAPRLSTRWQDLSKRANDILARPPTVIDEQLAQMARVEEEVKTLRREALLAHPVLQRYPVLFVARKQYKPDHHNTATLFQVGEVNEQSFEGGTALKCLDVAKGGTVETLIESPRGVIRDPEVDFDGGKVLFSMRPHGKHDYHIYEWQMDWDAPRALTRAPRISDFDPVYLPDGNIIFSSTREPKYCMCNQHIMANLFHMGGDGANIHQIGKSTLFEGHPALLNDGRILYDRWEYVDRNFGDAQGLWTVNPDGTGHAVYYGNNTWSPGGVIDARPIPDSEQIVCVLTSCHDRPWGAMAILDRRKGLDGRDPIVRTWPPEAIDLVVSGKGRPGYGFDIFKEVNPKYEDPYPLDANFFLCSRVVEGESMGLFVVDTFGNEVLLHHEAPGCFDPMPLAPRQRPPAIPARRQFDTEDGYVFVANVYEGTHMAGVNRGAVKWLRVIESPEKRYFTNPAWSGQGVHKPAMNWHSFENKRILGTVPVEKDGSAHFTVPAEAFVYFQLLDEAGMMVHSMRSGTIVQPGETLGCVGCHENRHSAPPVGLGKTPLAMRRAPSPLEGWYGPPRLFNFRQEVQPVFDKHCVECHDYGEEAGEELNLAGDRTLTFNTAYTELWRKGYTGAIGAGPAEIQNAYAWGSHTSKLMKTILDDHEDVSLDKESQDRIATWLDLNAVYYPVYASAYPDNLAGRSPLDDRQLKQLERLTGVPFAKLAGHNTNKGPQISFDRPALSPCLAPLWESDRDAYEEALAIIREGAEVLAAVPRGDDPNFQMAAPDAKRRDKYVRRQQAEQENRTALAKGERLKE